MLPGAAYVSGALDTVRGALAAAPGAARNTTAGLVANATDAVVNATMGGLNASMSGLNATLGGLLSGGKRWAPCRGAPWGQGAQTGRRQGGVLGRAWACANWQSSQI